jgi:hypothetical protein
MLVQKRILLWIGLLLIGVSALHAQGFPPFDLASRLDPAARLVFLQSDNTVVFTDAQSNMLAALPVPAGVAVQLVGDEVMYLGATDKGVGITATKADGSTRFIPTPPSTQIGEAVGWLPSPDRAQIAWLFDETPVPPDANNVCDPAAGCNGRVYELLLTDANGGGARSLKTWTIPAPYPTLVLVGWRSDQQAIFLKRVPAGIAGGLFSGIGGGLWEVAVSDGATTERSGDFLTNNEAISSDGRWLAKDTSMGQWLVRVDSTDGKQYSLPYQSNIAGELAFSPDNQRLAWVELVVDANSGSVTGMQLRVMTLADGSVMTLATIPASDTPSNANLWFNGRLLDLSVQGSTYLADVTTNEVGTWAIGDKQFIGLIRP